MSVRQISVFLDNKPGRLAGMTQVLADADINIRALYVADTEDYGILRMIVDNPDKAKKSLESAGFTITVTPVAAIALNDTPGALHEAVSAAKDLGISIEYMYAFSGKNSKNDAIVVLRLSDLDMADKLEQSGRVRMLAEKDILDMCR